MSVTDCAKVQEWTRYHGRSNAPCIKDQVKSRHCDSGAPPASLSSSGQVGLCLLIVGTQEFRLVISSHSYGFRTRQFCAVIAHTHTSILFELHNMLCVYLNPPAQAAFVSCRVWSHVWRRSPQAQSMEAMREYREQSLLAQPQSPSGPHNMNADLHCVGVHRPWS